MFLFMECSCKIVVCRSDHSQCDLEHLMGVCVSGVCLCMACLSVSLSLCGCAEADRIDIVHVNVGI